MFDNIAARVNGNETLVRRGRYVNVTMLLEAGDEGSVVRIVDGRIVSVTKGTHLMPAWTFALRAPRDAWETFLRPAPPPGFTDIFALQRKRLLRIEGDLQPFMANLLYFKDVLAALRPEAA